MGLLARAYIQEFRGARFESEIYMYNRARTAGELGIKCGGWLGGDERRCRLRVREAM